MGGRASCNEKGKMMLLGEHEVGDFDGLASSALVAVVYCIYMYDIYVLQLKNEVLISGFTFNSASHHHPVYPGLF